MLPQPWRSFSRTRPKYTRRAVLGSSMVPRLPRTQCPQPVPDWTNTKGQKMQQQKQQRWRQCWVQFKPAQGKWTGPLWSRLQGVAGGTGQAGLTCPHCPPREPQPLRYMLPLDDLKVQACPARTCDSLSPCSPTLCFVLGQVVGRQGGWAKPLFLCGS